MSRAERTSESNGDRVLQEVTEECSQALEQLCPVIPGDRRTQGMSAPYELLPRTLSTKTTVWCIKKSKRHTVRLACQALGWTFSNDINKLWTVGWCDLGERATYDSLRMHQKLNHIPGIEALTRKCRLAECLRSMAMQAPEEYAFHPHTWVLPKELTQLERYHDAALSRTVKSAVPPVYILKPDALSEGRNITLSASVDNLRGFMKKNKVNKAAVQVYVQRPMLCRGYKFDMRVYVLVTSVNPLRVFIYRDGLARFCAEPYAAPSSRNMANAYQHLTNYTVNKKSEKFQVPQKHSPGSDSVGDGAGEEVIGQKIPLPRDGTDLVHTVPTKQEAGKWTSKFSLSALNQFLMAAFQDRYRSGEFASRGGWPGPKKSSHQGSQQECAEGKSGTSSGEGEGGEGGGGGGGGRGPSPPHTVVEFIWQRISHVINKTMIAVLPELQHSYRCLFPHDRAGVHGFQFLGVDILLDAHLNVYLLEVNRNPSLRCSTDLDTIIKLPMISEAFCMLHPGSYFKQMRAQRGVMRKPRWRRPPENKEDECNGEGDERDLVDRVAQVVAERRRSQQHSGTSSGGKGGGGGGGGGGRDRLFMEARGEVSAVLESRLVQGRPDPTSQYALYMREHVEDWVNDHFPFSLAMRDQLLRIAEWKSPSVSACRFAGTDSTTSGSTSTSSTTGGTTSTPSHGSERKQTSDDPSDPSRQDGDGSQDRKTTSSSSTCWGKRVHEWRAGLPLGWFRIHPPQNTPLYPHAEAQHGLKLPPVRRSSTAPSTSQGTPAPPQDRCGCRCCRQCHTDHGTLAEHPLGRFLWPWQSHDSWRYAGSANERTFLFSHRQLYQQLLAASAGRKGSRRPFRLYRPRAKYRERVTPSVKSPEVIEKEEQKLMNQLTDN